MPLRYDTGTVARVERTEEGFLRLYATVSRVGDLRYRNPDGSDRIEHVDEETLFAPESLNSATLKPITLLHPPEVVTPSNSERYLKGLTGTKIVRDGDFLQVVATITHQDAIEAIDKRGLREVSAGYTTRVEQRDGKFYQRDRRYNHFAIVPKGRAGPEVRLHVDGDDDFAYQIDEAETGEPSQENFVESDRPAVDSTQEKAMATITINNRTYTVDGDDAPKLADAIAPVLNRLDELEKQATQQAAQLTEFTAERDRLQGELDGAKARIDAAESQRMDEDAIASQIQERLDAWQTVLPVFRKDDPSYSPDYSMDTAAIRRAYLLKVNPTLKLDSASADYISGLWEALKPTGDDSSDRLLEDIESAKRQDGMGYGKMQRPSRNRPLPGMQMAK